MNPEGKSLFVFAKSLSEHARHVEMGYPLQDYEIAILYLLLNNKDFYKNVTNNELGLKESIFANYIDANAKNENEFE